MKKNEIFRKLNKIILLERCQSAELRRGRTLVKNPKQGKPQVKTTMLPSFFDWVPSEIIEINEDFECDLMFRAMVIFAERMRRRNPQTKAVLIIDTDGQGFLHIYCWNQQRDDDYRATYEGQQVEWRDTMPKGHQFVGIDGIGYTKAENKKPWGKVIFLDGEFSFSNLIRVYANHKPNCGRLAVQNNKLILEIFENTDWNKYKEAMNARHFGITRPIFEQQQETKAVMRDSYQSARRDEEAQRQRKIANEKGLAHRSDVNFHDLRRGDMNAV